MPGRAGQAGRDHDDVRARGLLVAVRAGDVRLVAEHGAHLVDVERLALRQVLLDVDEDDVRVVARREHLRAGRADVSRADDRDLPSLRAPAGSYRRLVTYAAAGACRRNRSTVRHRRRADGDLSSIDAERGRPHVPRLRHRGSRRARDATRSRYLLLEGELPTDEELARVRATSLRSRDAAAADGRRSIDGQRAGRFADGDAAHRASRSLSFSDPAEAAIDRANERRKAAQLIAQLPTIVARYHRAPAAGSTPLAPDPSLSLRRELPDDAARRVAERRRGARVRRRDDPARRARDERVDVRGARRRRHAAPTCTPRSSPRSAALKGPLHGGANEAAMALLRARSGAPERRRDARPRDASSGRQTLYGFGHPLYRDDRPARGDPRSASSEQFSARTPASPNWYAITEAAERARPRSRRASGRTSTSTRARSTATSAC